MNCMIGGLKLAYLLDLICLVTVNLDRWYLHVISQIQGLADHWRELSFVTQATYQKVESEKIDWTEQSVTRRSQTKQEN